MTLVDHRGAGSRSRERTRIVYTQPPIQLARLVDRAPGGRFVVDLGGAHGTADVDHEVDPALLDDVHARQGRVLVESLADGGLRIAGVVQTKRAVEIDATGVVDAHVTSFRVRALRDVQLTTERAFVWLRGDHVEVYGKEVLTRARQIAKLVGQLITPN